MTPKQEIFYKMVLLDQVSQLINSTRATIKQELLEKGTDPLLFMRRVRMLSQIARYEAQIYLKIYHFAADSLDDYQAAVPVIRQEIASVVNRSS